MTPLLTGLLRTRSISSKDIGVLRQLVDDLEAKSQNGKHARRRS